MCPDSEIAKGVKMSCTKVSYVIGHELGPYFLQKTVDDILNTPGTYFTLHFDETTTSQIKKQFDILVRYYLDNHNEVRVRFLKVAVFGHAYAESVANELCETLQKFSLPLKYLLSLSSDGPNVNKAIKTNINSKLKANYQRELLIQDLVNYMWYTIVSGKELRDMVQMWKICVLIYTTSCHHQGEKIMLMYSKN